MLIFLVFLYTNKAVELQGYRGSTVGQLATKFEGTPLDFWQRPQKNQNISFCRPIDKKFWLKLPTQSLNMKIKFCGAAQTVTGSKHLLKLDSGQQILLDCGLFQGIDTSELNLNFMFEVQNLAALVVSHAHIDHTGLIPRLYKLGFRGPIYATPATMDLCQVMLMDSAHIQEKDLERINKRRVKRGEQPIEQLYDEKDVEGCMGLFEAYGYHKTFDVIPGVKACFYDAAHILGSAGVYLEIEEAAKTKKIFFTGDIGRPNDRILRMPDAFPEVDHIICESTYGNKLHEAEPDLKGHLLRVIKQTCVENQGKVLIPAFSVDRTQELIYALDELSSAGLLPNIPVFVDSKLSVAATQIMAKHEECFNPNILQYIKRDGNAFGFKNLHYITEVEDSKKLNDRPGACVIISSSGMAEAGRIKHHIKNGIENPCNTVLIVGYCTPNSLGGALKRGDKKVRIFGEEFNVQANIEVMDSFSAHGDYTEMIAHLSCQNQKATKNIYLVHGEIDTQRAFKARLETAGFGKVHIPELGQEYDA
jgi:metallo-beta-lactamase family protein